MPRRSTKTPTATPAKRRVSRWLEGKPYGFRLGVTTDWKSRWFEERNYQNCVIEDWEIRDYLMSQLESAGVSRIEIERTRDRLRVDDTAGRAS